MLTKIVKVLEKCGIDHWYLADRTEETAELFFVKKQLDTRRIKDTRKYRVTVFRDGDGKKTRGFTAAEILPGDSEEEMERKLTDAYFAAQFAMNPYYDLPDPVKAPRVEKAGELAEAPLAESAGKIAAALFAADTREDAFLNSAEVFVSREAVRILTSAGTDVSYTDARAEGEFVVQCKVPEDVEMHHQFSCDTLDPESLKKQVSQALDFVAHRAGAQKILKSGKYDLVLSGKNAGEVLSYYATRADASMVYAKYSTWQPGDDVQAGDESGIAGEKLDLTLCATVPFSPEGISMKDLPLLREGRLENIHGGNQFCRYLGIRPTGSYRKFRCENPGTASFEEMKKKPCLWAVAFSDFQMDAFSGHFGGEIRLAYLIHGDTVTPVTGGSVNGSLLEAQKEITFSTDRFASSEYDGPYAMRMKNISVAGVE